MQSESKSVIIEEKKEEVVESEVKETKATEQNDQEDNSTKDEINYYEDFIRIRQKHPKIFIKKSLTQIKLSKDGDIQVVVGILPHEIGYIRIQTVIFDKVNWTLSEAKNWEKQNKELLKKAISIADLAKVYLEEYSNK